jgi:hypothetical protein
MKEKNLINQEKTFSAVHKIRSYNTTFFLSDCFFTNKLDKINGIGRN